MTDVHSPETRSYNMSRIRSKDTKPEERVRKYLFAKGFRYRKNDKRLPGKPDIVLPKYKTVVFINGCFWHRHEGYKCFKWPSSNVDFWREKLQKNVERDKKNYNELLGDNWKVIVLWECKLKSKSFDDTMTKLINHICLSESKDIFVI